MEKKPTTVVPEVKTQHPKAKLPEGFAKADADPKLQPSDPPRLHPFPKYLPPDGTVRVDATGAEIKQ